VRTSIWTGRPKSLARASFASLLVVIACLASMEDKAIQALHARADENPDLNHVVSELAKGEAEFRTALDRYSYKRDWLVRTVNSGRVTGEFHRISQFYSSSDGKLLEKIISFPQPTLREVAITREDLDNVSPANQFILQLATASKCKFTYAGKEQIDDADFFVFDVKPSGKEHLFHGRIWVRVKDLRIVKLRGKWVEQKDEQRFPVMEIHRMAVDGKYLFPSYAIADEELAFRTSHTHVRVEVHYTDYIMSQ